MVFVFKCVGVQRAVRWLQHGILLPSLVRHLPSDHLTILATSFLAPTASPGCPCFEPALPTASASSSCGLSRERHQP